MALKVWLPLDGDLIQQGTAETTFSGTPLWKSYGKIGNSALNLQNRITCTTPALNGTQFFTVTFWARIEDNPDSTANWMDVIGFTDQTSTGSNGQFRFETGYGNAAYGGVHWHDNTTNAIIDGSYTYNNASEFNNWHHIAITVSNEKICSYYDGELKSTHTSYLNKGHLTGNWWIGESTTRGCIQDVRIYDDALSTAEIKEISRGLVLHYKLDDSLQNANWLTSNTTFSITRSDGNAFADSGYNATLTSNSDTLYKVECDAKGTASDMFFDVYFRNSSGAAYAVTPKTAITTAWQHYSLTINGSPSTMTIFRTRCYGGTAGDIIYIRNLRLISNSTPFNGNIEDSSGYNHNGTTLNTVGVSSDSPRYNISTNLVNANSMINCGRGGMVTDSITVNVWIKSSAWGNPVSCTEGGGWNFEATGDYFRFPVYISGVGYKYGQTAHTRAQVCNNQWHMLTGVYDRLNQKVKIYVDGELDNEVSTGSSNNIGYNGSNVIWLGAEATGSATAASNGMAGLFSDFRIYCTPLLDTDIKQLYNVDMKVDNLGGVHGYEFIEEINNIKENEIVTNTTDKTISYNKNDNTYTFLLSPHSSGAHLLWYPTKNRTVTNHSVEIPWGYSFVHTFEIFSDKTANLSIDYNNASIDSNVTLSGNDNDTNRLPSPVSLTENTWKTVTFSYSNTNESKNPNHVTLYDYSCVYVAAHDDSYTIKIKSPMTYVVDNDSKMSINKNGIISYNQFLESSTKNYGSISKKTRAVEASTFIEM